MNANANVRQGATVEKLKPGQSASSAELKKETTEPLPATHCLLSEFDTPVFRWLGIARSKHAGWYMALACFVWAALTILFGHLVGANACGLQLQAIVTQPNGEKIVGKLDLVWGWLAQVNAGPFYLLIAPVLLIITHRFLIACGESLQQLHASGRLKIVGTNISSWHREMARRNRICVLALWTLPVFLAICFNVQLSSVNRALKGYPTKLAAENGGKDKWSEIGYSQSIAFENWTRDFELLKSANSDCGTDEKLTILTNQRWLPALEMELFNETDRRNAFNNSPLAACFDFKDGRPSAVHLQDAWTNASLKLEAKPLRAPKDSLLGWKKYAEGRSAWPGFFVACYCAFIVFEQILIAAFFTFGVWLTFKIVFWLVQVYEMLPRRDEVTSEPESGLCRLIQSAWVRPINWLRRVFESRQWVEKIRGATHRWLNKLLKSDSRCQLELSPLLNDPSGRYGLGALFRPYNLLVLTAAIGASYIALSLPFGVHLKDITSPDGAGSGATALGHLIVITIVFSAIVCGPIWFFPIRLGEWARKERLENLYRELSAGANTKTLLQEEANILKQTTWPSGDNYFKVTLAIILAVLLLPLGSALDFLPGEAVTATRLPQVVREKCRQIAADWYHLHPSKE